MDLTNQSEVIGDPSSSAQSAAASSKFSVKRFISKTSAGSRNSGHQPRASSGSVRVVGRGGVGSRPRLIPVADSAGTPVAMIPRPNPRRMDSTRIMGRGGAGARPRKLDTAEDSRITPAHPVHVSSPAMNNGASPVVYRPTGRGGAGSRQPKAKAPPDLSKPSKRAKSLWKGKGRETAACPDVNSLNENAFTRTDTISTSISEIAFAAAPTPAAPRPSTRGTQPAVLRGNNFSKLARTLGIDVPASGLWLDRSPVLQDFRRHSISTLATQDVSVVESRSGRDILETGTLSYLDLDVSEGARAMDEQRRVSPSEFGDGTDAASAMHPSTADSDAGSEINDDYAVADSDTHSATSTSSMSISQLHPSFSTDIHEDGVLAVDSVLWSRSPTPRPGWPSVDAEKPSLEGAGSFVVSSGWDSLAVRNEPAHGWYGQWNRDDMGDVIRGLRKLRI